MHTKCDTYSLNNTTPRTVRSKWVNEKKKKKIFAVFLFFEDTLLDCPL